MEGEETLMMFGKAADFNRDMYQINIASMDVLMQLVQVVDSMREGQGVIMDALERTPAGLVSGPTRLKMLRTPIARRGSAAWRVASW